MVEEAKPPAEEQLDPRTLGVPGLMTVVPPSRSSGHTVPPPFA